MCNKSLLGTAVLSQTVASCGRGKPYIAPNFRGWRSILEKCENFAPQIWCYNGNIPDSERQTHLYFPCFQFSTHLYKLPSPPPLPPSPPPLPSPSLPFPPLPLSLPSPQILDHLSLIPEQSRVSQYVRKTLTKKRQSGVGGGKGEKAGGEGTDGREGGKILRVSAAGNVKKVSGRE